MPESQYYVTYLQTTWKDADDARKPLEKLWRDAWDVFHNRFDYSKKAGWQTKLRWSRFAGTIETFAAVLKRAMIEARVWWVAEGTDETGKLRAPLIKRLVDVWLRVANFVTVFTDGLKLGGIADMIALKFTWPQWDEQDVSIQEIGTSLAGLGEPIMAPQLVTKRRAGLKVELYDPFKVWLDPTGRNRYVIEESTTDYDSLQAMARLAPGEWDADAIGKLTASAYEAQQQYDERIRQGLAQSGAPPWRKPVTLRTYWGDVVNDQTFQVERNIKFVVANDTALVGKVRPIPFWHVILDRRMPNKRGPFVWGFPFRVPLSAYGKGLARDNLDLATLLTELNNAIGDQTVFAGINAFEVDKDLIDDPEQFKDGVYPGKTFTKREGAQGRNLIEPRQLGNVNPELLAVAGFFDRNYQNSTGVTDYVGPAIPSRKTATLGEYQGRQGQSLGLLDMVARNLEDQLLEPSLETIYWLILQYMDDFTIPEVTELLGQDATMLAAMPDVVRFQFLKANLRFSARGISVVMAKEAELAKIVAFIQGVPMLAQLIPDLPARINTDALLRKIWEGLGWDPDEILRAPQETAIEQAAIPGQPMDGMMPTMPASPPMTPGLPPGGMQ